MLVIPPTNSSRVTLPASVINNLTAKPNRTNAIAGPTSLRGSTLNNGRLPWGMRDRANKEIVMWPLS